MRFKINGGVKLLIKFFKNNLPMGQNRAISIKIIFYYKNNHVIKG